MSYDDPGDGINCCDSCPLSPTCEEEHDFRASLRPGDGEPDEYRDR